MHPRTMLILLHYQGDDPPVRNFRGVHLYSTLILCIVSGKFAVSTRDGPVQFPAEILVSILEMAVYQDPSTAAKLASVSKDVRDWVAPVLYRTVTLETTQQLISFSRTVQTSPYMSGNEVRTLIIQGNGSRDMMHHVEAAICGCPKLETLLTEGSMPPDPAFPQLPCFWSTYPNPKHAVFLGQTGMESGSIPYQVHRHALLQNVTHLHIQTLNVTDVAQGMLDVTVLTEMLSLTHLACGCDVDKYGENFVRHVEHILRGSFLLRVFLVLSFNWSEPDRLVGPVWMDLAQNMDERLLAGHAIDDDDYVALVSSGGTIWDHAEIRCKDWREKVEDGPLLFEREEECCWMDVDSDDSEDEVTHCLRETNQAEVHWNAQNGDGVYMI